MGTTGDTAEAASNELDDIEQEHVCRHYFAVVSVLFYVHGIGLVFVCCCCNGTRMSCNQSLQRLWVDIPNTKSM